MITRERFNELIDQLQEAIMEATIRDQQERPDKIQSLQRAALVRMTLEDEVFP